MAHETAEVTHFPLRRLDRFPPKMALLCGALFVVGAVAFAAAMMADPDRAWRAYLSNWLFWISIAQGAVIFAAAITMTRGVWARSVRRIALSFVAFLPIGFLLMLPLLFQGEHIFPWIGEHLHGGKELWLTVPFVAFRNVIGMAALVGLSLAFAYRALRPDAGILREEAPGRGGPWLSRLTRGWSGTAAEEDKSTHRLRVLAPILALVWAVAFSFVAFDFIMSLEPEWWSTLFGPYFFMPGFLGGIAATALATIAYRKSLGLDDFVGTPQRHDLGKLIFGFCIFWAYLFWAQFLVIWYGLLPYEQFYVAERFSDPYTPFALLILFCMFVIPFFGLLGAKAKKMPLTLGLFSGIILFGLWVERWFLVYPSFYEDAATAPLGWMEVGTALGFAGIFLASLVWFATRFPMLQMWESWSEAQILGTTSEPPGTTTVTAE